MRLDAVLIVAAGMAIGAVFVRRQHRLPHPLLDLGLFRVRPFVVCLSIYVLGAFAAFGTFLTFAQYLQLVLGLRPLEAGLWTAPSGVAFVLGSLIAPPLTRYVRAKRVMAAGLAMSAAGSAVLTQIDGGSGLGAVMIGFLLFSFGLSLTFTLAVDLVVSSAPPERAGGASALAETGAELGGAVGIAILGSIFTLIYRAGMADTTPAGVPLESTQTLGGAAETARQLPGPLGAQLLEASREAFSSAMNVTAAVCALAMVAASLSAAFLIPDPRDAPPAGDAPADDEARAATPGPAATAATARS
jgi:DHA2 family multidrug resistance protein-like MFS transporter